MERALTGRGQYDLNFIDWNNEWEARAESNDLSGQNYTDESLLPEQSPTLIVENRTSKKYKEIKRRLKLMKMGKTKRKCVICMMDFQVGEKILRIPKCKHIYHQECLDPWIRVHSTCPMCRVELLENEIN